MTTCPSRRSIQPRRVLSPADASRRASDAQPTRVQVRGDETGEKARKTFYPFLASWVGKVTWRVYIRLAPAPEETRGAERRRPNSPPSLLQIRLAPFCNRQIKEQFD